MKRTKIFAAYLPQYHETEDNNNFWGVGYTDWVGVKKATPLFRGHNQPKVPLNDNYYDLLDVDVISWQAQLAKKYGIDGFNIYHYWFKDGKQELEKPAELLLHHSEIDIKYFFTWDNCAWKRTWSNVTGNDWAPLFEDGKNNSISVLVDFDYGDELQWRKHFDYLLQFFQDSRYFKINNMPVFAFMTTFESVILEKMADKWDLWAKESGFNGLYLITQKGLFRDKIQLKNQFIYEPITSAWGHRKAIGDKLSEKLHISMKPDSAARFVYDYDKVWKKIIQTAQRTNCVHGCFVRYDDTPRRGKNAGIIINETPKKFGEYFEKFYKICCEKSDEFLLITAWNEWGEGAFLEPDAKEGFMYLDELKRVVEAKNIPSSW